MPTNQPTQLTIIETVKTVEPTVLDLEWIQQRQQQRNARRTLLHEFFGNLYDPEIGAQDKARWKLEWLNQRNLWLAQQSSAHTRLAYSRALAEWDTYLYEVYAIEYPWLVDTEHVIAWQNHMASAGSVISLAPRPLSPATINQRLAAVSSYYSHIESCTKMADGQQIGLFVTGDGYPRRNPFLSAALSRPKTTPYATAKAVPTAAMQWILRTLGDKPNKTIADHRDYALLLAFYRTGYRAASTLEMRWRDFDENAAGGAIFDWKGKGGKSKRKTLSARIYNAIIAYLKADGRYAPGLPHHIQDDHYIWRPLRIHGVANFDIFALDENRHITPSSATEILRRHLARFFRHKYLHAGYTPAAASAEAQHSAAKYHLHSLRHTFASEMAQASQENILLIQQLLDHESADTTRIYIGAIKQPEDKATALLEQQFGL